MRLRNVPRAIPVLQASPYVEQEPYSHKGEWHTLFGNDHPIHVELGMGKGKFITAMAMEHPEINYIGIERQESVLLRAEEKQEELKLSNLILLWAEGDDILSIFGEDELDRIYLNFSDPWPKERHANRRLTSGRFLERYNVCLKKDGYIAFKTDNRTLFDWSLESVEENGWHAKDVTYDLHNSEYAEGNIMTEYEEKFSGMGTPINRAVFWR